MVKKKYKIVIVFNKYNDDIHDVVHKKDDININIKLEIGCITFMISVSTIHNMMTSISFPLFVFAYLM